MSIRTRLIHWLGGMVESDLPPVCQVYLREWELDAMRNEQTRNQFLSEMGKPNYTPKE